MTPVCAAEWEQHTSAVRKRGAATLKQQPHEEECSFASTPSRLAAGEVGVDVEEEVVDGGLGEIEVRQLFELEDFTPSEAIERFRDMTVGSH